ncbi:hypothetical protein AFM12_07285 [Jiulongibacter sediminis]|uniref:Uncharacterized protein n=1 Tax=Jiulongibacter sediminis TaxID=1605367 RepID=A0A0P7BCT0_9BACT|nr:hypothetical protein AFM12_07285 [Jiulongibacter sediminis]TBX24971.1 hypothetical protein TK44_07290 [Jiulongibacter sediminis]
MRRYPFGHNSKIGFHLLLGFLFLTLLLELPLIFIGPFNVNILVLLLIQILLGIYIAYLYLFKFVQLFHEDDHWYIEWATCKILQIADPRKAYLKNIFNQIIVVNVKDKKLCIPIHIKHFKRALDFLFSSDSDKSKNYFFERIDLIQDLQ